MSLNNLYYTPANNIPLVSITEKCIVLDLDQTLISTQDHMELLFQLKLLSDPGLMHLRNRIYTISIEDLDRPGIGTKYDMWGITRPHVQDFLIFCFSYFKIVAVWSAGKRPYVEAIVDHLFKDLPQPHVVFSRDDVVRGANQIIIKPLIKMIESDPQLKQNMTLKNTLAIDDTTTTFHDNIANGIHIPEYDPTITVLGENPLPNIPANMISPLIKAFEKDDQTLLQLKYWFLQPEVINSKDVTTLDKTKIFTTSVDNYKLKLQNLSGYNFLR